jgi:hypothetical protein
MNKITLLKIALLCSVFSFAQTIDTTKYQKVAPGQGQPPQNYYNQNNNGSNGDTIKNYYPPDQNQNLPPNQPAQYQPYPNDNNNNNNNNNSPGRGNGGYQNRNNNNNNNRGQIPPQSPLMEKLYFGCNVGLSYYGQGTGGTNVLYYDLSPNAGYKFNKVLSAGVQIVYNNSILYYGNVHVSYSVVGAGLFGRALIPRTPFFLQVEYDILSVPQDYLGTAVAHRTLSDEKMAGIGYKRGGKISYYLVAMYDFNPTYFSPYYGNPLVIRLGFVYNY